MTSHRRRRGEGMPHSTKDKARDSSCGRDKSDCQEIQKTSLPLFQKSVYIDVKSGKQAEVIEGQLKKLGATIEKFLSREVNYVISSSAPPTKVEERSSTEDNPASPSFSVPSPFSSIPSPTPPSEAKAPVVSRGKALAQIAYARSRASTVVTNAEKWGIKVIAVETASKWLDREIQKFGKEDEKSSSKKEATKKEVQKAKKKVVKRKKKTLKGCYIKFESMDEMYRPIKSELDKWPRVNVLAPPGLNPYCDVKMKLHNFLRRHSSMRNTRGSASSGKGSLKKTRSMSSIKENASLVTTTPQATADVVAVPITTTGDVKRHLGLVHRRRPDKLQGFCECCRVKYKDMNQHIKEDGHQSFARDKSNFESLDTLIKQVPSTSQFLQDILLRHCVQKQVETVSHNVREPREVTTKLDIDVMPVISPIPSEATPHAAEGTVSPSKSNPKTPILSKEPCEQDADDTEDTRPHAVVIRRRTPSGVFVSPRRREPTPSKRPWMQERFMVFRDSPMASLQPSGLNDTSFANLSQSLNDTLDRSCDQSKNKSIVRSLIDMPDFISSPMSSSETDRLSVNNTEEDMSLSATQKCMENISEAKVGCKQSNLDDINSVEMDRGGDMPARFHVIGPADSVDLMGGAVDMVQDVTSSKQFTDVFVPCIADRVKRRSRVIEAAKSESIEDNTAFSPMHSIDDRIDKNTGEDDFPLDDGLCKEKLNLNKIESNFNCDSLQEAYVEETNDVSEECENDALNIVPLQDCNEGNDISQSIVNPLVSAECGNMIEILNASGSERSKMSELLKRNESTPISRILGDDENIVGSKSSGSKSSGKMSLKRKRDKDTPHGCVDKATPRERCEKTPQGHDKVTPQGRCDQVTPQGRNKITPQGRYDRVTSKGRDKVSPQSKELYEKGDSKRRNRSGSSKRRNRSGKRDRRKKSFTNDTEQAVSTVNVADSVKSRIRRCRLFVHEGFYADDKIEVEFESLANFELEKTDRSSLEMKQESTDKSIDSFDNVKRDKSVIDMIAKGGSSFEIKLNRITESGKRIFRGKKFHTTQADWNLNKDEGEIVSDDCENGDPIRLSVGEDDCENGDPIRLSVGERVKNRRSCTLFNHSGQYANDGEGGERNDDVDCKVEPSSTSQSPHEQCNGPVRPAIVHRRLPFSRCNLTKTDRTWCKLMSKKDWTQFEDDAQVHQDGELYENNSFLSEDRNFNSLGKSKSLIYGQINEVNTSPVSDKKTASLRSHPIQHLTSSGKKGSGIVESGFEKFKSPQKGIAVTNWVPHKKSSQERHVFQNSCHKMGLNGVVQDNGNTRSPRLKLKIKRDVESDCYSSTLEELQEENNLDSRNQEIGPEKNLLGSSCRLSNELSPSNRPFKIDRSDSIDLLETPGKRHIPSDCSTKFLSAQNISSSPSSPHCKRNILSLKKKVKKKRKFSDTERESCMVQNGFDRPNPIRNESLHEKEFTESHQQLEIQINRPMKRRRRNASMGFDNDCQMQQDHDLSKDIEITSPMKRNQLKSSLPISSNCAQSSPKKRESMKQTCSKQEMTNQAVNVPKSESIEFVHNLSPHKADLKSKSKPKKRKRKHRQSDGDAAQLSNKKSKLDCVKGECFEEKLSFPNSLLSHSQVENNAKNGFLKSKSAVTDRDHERGGKLFTEPSFSNVGDLLHFVPNFSSPAKTNSSWDDAFDSYLNVSLKSNERTPVNDSLLINQASTSVMWSPFKLNSPAKSRTIDKRNFQTKKIDCNSISSVKAVISSVNSHNICVTPTKRSNSLSKTASPSVQKVDSVISFNHMSPQRLHFSPMKLKSPVRNLEKSPGRRKIDSDVSFNHVNPQRLTFSPSKKLNA